MHSSQTEQAISIPSAPILAPVPLPPVPVIVSIQFITPPSTPTSDGPPHPAKIETSPAPPALGLALQQNAFAPEHADGDALATGWTSFNREGNTARRSGAADSTKGKMKKKKKNPVTPATATLDWEMCKEGQNFMPPGKDN
jgi:hypothetical protein